MSRNSVSRALVLITLSTSILSVFATPAPAHDRVLVPIYLAEPVAGANGSRWKTDFAIYNGGPASAHLLWCSPAPADACPADLREDEEVKAGERQTVLPRRQHPPASSAVPGRVVYFAPLPDDGGVLSAAAADAENLTFALRVFDTSRSELSAGTEIPVVRQSSFRTSATDLVNIPVDSNFRVTLRLYEMNLDRADFLIVVYDHVMARIHDYYRVSVTTSTPQNELRFEPGYLVLDNLRPFDTPSRSSSRVRIHIEPLSAGSAFWAFVSVTNNTTQQVTLVTPH